MSRRYLNKTWNIGLGLFLPQNHHIYNIYICITWNKSDWVWLGLIGFGPLQPAKKSDQVWLGLIGFGLLQPAKKSDWVWLGLIKFGLLQPAKKSDWVWSGLIGFGPLQPATKMIGYGWVWLALICYNLQRKEIRYGWVWSALVHYNLKQKWHGSIIIHVKIYKYVLTQVWNTVSLSSLIILSKLQALLEGSLVFFAIPKFLLLTTNLPHPTHSIIGPCGPWPPSSFWSLRNRCHSCCHCHVSFFYLSSFYSHAISFHHISSSSFPHVSFSFCHVSFLEAWLELVTTTAWEVTHFVYFICKIFSQF